MVNKSSISRKFLKSLQAGDVIVIVKKSVWPTWLLNLNIKLKSWFHSRSLKFTSLENSKLHISRLQYTIVHYSIVLEQ